MTDTRNRAVAAVAAALQETILTSPDRYRGPGMGAYRTPYEQLDDAAKRHVNQDAAAFLDALTPEGRRAIAAELLDEEALARAMGREGERGCPECGSPAAILAALRGDA